MAYKVILVHLDTARNTDVRIHWAIHLAKTQQAHLIGVSAVGLSRYYFESALSTESIYPVFLDLEEARNSAKEVARQFKEACDRAGGTSCESHIIEDDAFGSLEKQARYCDLLILGQYDAEKSFNPMDASLARDMLLSSGGPVLIIPKANTSLKPNPGQRILIAWNGSVEARRVVRDAIPLLHLADTVNIVVFNPDGHGEDPGARLIAYLHHHGIAAHCSTEVATYHDVHERLSAKLVATKSDLLVMGGYGHTPFYETMLGGVTRAVLLGMPVPVLMSH